MRLLAHNPLLCAVVCALHVDMRQTMPNRRKEIYEAAISMLLSRRDEKRDVASSDATLGLAEKQVLLRDMAFWLTVNDRSEMARRDAEHLVSRALAFFRHEARLVAPEAALKDLVLRSGLIRFPTDDTVEFAHRTFQEFLAAAEIVEGVNIPMLRDRILDAEWQQVIAWASAFMNREQASDFFAFLASEIEKSTDGARQRLVLLALACAEVALHLDSNLRALIEQHGRALVPPASMDAVAALSGIGTAAVPLIASALPRSEEWQVATDPSVDFSLQALIRIGGQDALAVLAGLPLAIKATAQRRLADGWAYFEPQGYAQSVLADVPLRYDKTRIVVRDAIRAQQTVHLSEAFETSADLSANDADPLQGPTFATLRLRADFDVIDIGLISGIKHVGRLVIQDAVGLAGDLHATPTLQGVFALRVESFTEPCEVDMASIAKLPGLRRLELVGHIAVKNVDVLAAAEDLQSVRISTGTRATAVGGWRGSFRELDVVGWSEPDLSSLCALQTLETLRITGSTSLISCAGVEGLQQLSSVEFVECVNLSECNGLRDLPNLRSFALNECESFIDQELLLDLSDTVELDVQGTGIDTRYRDTEPEVEVENLLLRNTEDMSQEEIDARNWDLIEAAMREDSDDDDDSDVWPEPMAFTEEDADRRGYIIVESLENWDVEADGPGDEVYG